MNKLDQVSELAHDMAKRVEKLCVGEKYYKPIYKDEGKIQAILNEINLPNSALYHDPINDDFVNGAICMAKAIKENRRNDSLIIK